MQATCFTISFERTEPAIHRRNEDSCGNENQKSRKKHIFHEKKSTSILFSMKIKMMNLWMQIEGTNQIFIVNFSVLDFFKFASRMPQIAQNRLVSRTPPRNFLFFSLAIPGSERKTSSRYLRLVVFAGNSWLTSSTRTLTSLSSSCQRVLGVWVSTWPQLTPSSFMTLTSTHTMTSRLRTGVTGWARKGK